MFRQLRQFFKIEYILLFLVAFEFLDKHHFVIFALFAYLFLKSKLSWSAINVDFVWLFMWGASYLVFAFNHQWSILQTPSLLCAFIIGYSMISDKNSVFLVLFIIGFGYALEGMLTVSLSGGMIEFAEDEMSRTLPSLWGGHSRAISAQAVTFYIYSGLLVYLLQNKDIGIHWKLLALFFEMGFLYNAMRIASRSATIMCPIIILASYFAYTGFRNKSKSFLVLFLLVIAFVGSYAMNVFGIRDAFEHSFLLQRFAEDADGGIRNNSRFELHSRFFDTWYLALWGGLHDINRYWFHNTWLDMYAYSGIFGFITFTIVTLRALSNYIFIYKRVDRGEKSIWTGSILAFYLPFWMDPMLWAAPGYFALFILFCGALSKRRVIVKQERYSVRQNHRPYVRQMPI